MATKRRRAGSPQRLDRDLMEQLLFGTGGPGGSRRTRRCCPTSGSNTRSSQRTPTAASRERPGRVAALPPTRSRRSSCYFTPFREVPAGEVRRKVRERLPVERQTAAWRSFGHAPEPLPRVVYNLSTVAATLHFEDLVRVVLPMTEWWHRLLED